MDLGWVRLSVRVHMASLGLWSTGVTHMSQVWGTLGPVAVLTSPAGLQQPEAAAPPGSGLGWANSLLQV